MKIQLSRRGTDGVWTPDLPDWDGESTLVQVFGSSAVLDDPSALGEIDRQYPTSVVVGCSGAGAVIGDEITDEDVVVAVASFDRVRVSAVFGAVEPEGDHQRTAEELREKLLAQDPDAAAFLVMAGGLDTDGDSISAGLSSGDGRYIAMGGLAGSLPEEDSFGPTWVLDANRRPVGGAVSIVGLSGEALTVDAAARGGWKPLGPERTVTAASGTTLLGIDGQPALDLYREYLGDRAAELPAVAALFPLARRARDGSDDDWAPAGCTGIDEETCGLQLTRSVSVGDKVQMLRGIPAELFDAAEEAAESLDVPAASPALAVVTSCIGRRVSMGSRTADELMVIRDVLPDRVTLVGFYSMGEFSPTASTACMLYNYTMTVALLGERAG